MSLPLLAACLVGGCTVEGSWHPSTPVLTGRREVRLADRPQDTDAVFKPFLSVTQPGVLFLRAHKRAMCRYAVAEVYRESERFRCPDCAPSYHLSGWLMAIGAAFGAGGAGLVAAGAHEDRAGDPPDSKKVYRLVGGGAFCLAWAALLLPIAVWNIIDVAKLKRALKNKVRLLSTEHVQRRVATRDCGSGVLANAAVEIRVPLPRSSNRGVRWVRERAKSDPNGVIQVDLASAMAKAWASGIGDHVRVTWKGKEKTVTLGPAPALARLTRRLVQVLKPQTVGTVARQWKVALGGSQRPRLARLALRCARETSLEVTVRATHPNRLSQVSLVDKTVPPGAVALVRRGRPLRLPCRPDQTVRLQILAKACCQTSMTISARAVAPKPPPKPRPEHGPERGLEPGPEPGRGPVAHR